MVIMRVLVAFYSKTGVTVQVAQKIKDFFESKKAVVELFEIKPLKEKEPKDYARNEEVELKKFPFSINDFDLVFVGTPVWGSSATPIVVSFLKKLGNISGKKFVLFASCHGFTGSAIKKMSSIVATKDAIVLDFFTIKSLFSLNEKKLKEIEIFCEKFFSKI